MRDILALATKYGTWPRGMQYAGGLAAALGGSLTGIFVSEPVPTIGMPMAYPEFQTLASDVAREAMEAAPSFERWAGNLGIGEYRWQVAQGRVESVLARLSNWHDVLVLESGEDVMFGSAQILGRLLLTAGISCVVVPQHSSGWVVPDTVAIAWNGAPESMRAIQAALPLLCRAKRVLLIDGQGTLPYSTVAWHPELNIDRYLSSHRIAFESLRFEANTMDAGRGLLEAASEAQADLLVMGAYGHSRFGEWVFGGATEYVLRNCKLPVLFCH